jgi:hypothetical protein
METTDRIETTLVEIETTIGQLRAAQVELLAKVDRRQTPLADGCRTLTEWTASRLDVAPETARLLTRMVHTNASAVTDGLADGGLTFDRATELIRLTNPTPDEIEGSRSFDIAGLRRLIAHDRVLTPVEERDTYDSRHLVMQPNLDHTTWRLWGQLPGHEGALVDKVLTDTADTFPPPPPGAVYTRTQRRADALVAVCTNQGGDGPSSVISVFVDATHHAQLGTNTRPSQFGVRTQVAAGPRIGPATLERLLCDATVEVTAITENGQPLAIGRRTAAIPPRLKRFVLWRDQGCVIDGCTSRYRLQPHHITPYSQGGTTNPDNLATVCWYHHHVVIHTLGYHLDPTSPPHRRRFTTPPTRPGPGP